MGIQLIVADIDGTLLDETLVLSPEVVSRVSQLRCLGVGFTLATGRIFSSAAHLGRQLGLDLPLIANGGAVIQPLHGGALRHLVLAPQLVEAALEHTAGWPARRYLLTRDCIFAEDHGLHAQTYGRRLGVVVKAVAHLAGLSEPVTQLVIRLDPQSAAARLGEAQNAFQGELAVEQTMPHLIEFMHQDASKGKALGCLAAHLGVNPAQVMAVGDGINDLDMLAVAGLGVLVGNADPSLWQRADVVTKSHHYRGLLEALESFVKWG